MKFYLYFNDDVFTHIFDIEEVRLSNENLYNKIMKQNFYIGNWNELVLSNDFEYKSVYEIESNYTKEQLLKMDISDKEYEENLKEYVDKVGTEKREPLIVPNENFKKMFNKIIK